MRYEKIKTYKNEKFRRLTGVKKETFAQMLQALHTEMRDFGRPTTLNRADQLLLTLMYWREYRTQFHIGETYGVSESTVCRTIQKVENALLRSGQFRLPGKKALQESDTLIEVIIVDVAEQPIERPKKSKNDPTAAKRSDTRKKHR
jgi:hypothetical protein